MNTPHSRLHPLALFFAALIALTLVAAGATAAAAEDSGRAPIVTIDGGAVRGGAVAGGYAFRGLPYALPPLETCGGGPQSRRPRGMVSGTRPSSRRVAPNPWAPSGLGSGARTA